MEWRHYEVRAAGTVVLADDNGSPIAATYEMGIVSTGRSRVFSGHFVRTTLPSGAMLSGEDRHSLRAALRRLASNICAVKFGLCCVGLDPSWRESGLSVDTGWGYFGDHDRPATHMMDAVPVDAAGDDIDRLIAETVAGIRIGIQQQ